MKRLQILIDPDVFESVRRYAFNRKISIGEAVRRAINAFLEDK